MIDSTFEPKIIGFFCNWCTYAGADLAGVSRFQYPTNMRIIRIPCSGRISAKMILHAIRSGADGIWISGCHPGDCHYIEGNYYARRKFTLLKELLEYTGLEPGRLQFSWISSAEGVKFAAMAQEVIEAVRKLGPASRIIKTLPEVA